MKTINLRGISETLNEKELKNVMGGVQQYMFAEAPTDNGGGGGGCSAKANNCLGESCTKDNGKPGKCNTRPAETMCRCL
jgi:bacteriocin-like protein